jgi:hypothetical protein
MVLSEWIYVNTFFLFHFELFFSDAAFWFTQEIVKTNSRKVDGHFTKVLVQISALHF